VTARAASAPPRGSASIGSRRFPIVTPQWGSASRLRAQSASGSPAATSSDPSSSSTNPTAAVVGAPDRRPWVSSSATTPQPAS
jgi:hypothetical protein